MVGWLLQFLFSNFFWQWFQVRLGAGSELIVAPKKQLLSTPSNDAKVSENGKVDKTPM